ncbi:hypothetical protein AW909_17665 [Pseudomonas aeruginosa]|nr:hypothetical protein A6747_20960 [Pseudomonas aeruginosa]EQM90693.1 hypothetical protein L683_04400 [Pseudomonas aeruginosa WC55]EWH30114.1 hypothetical protein Z695_0117895 [Pseudomonas aeruginosa SG17M]KKJ47041.1 hypothetical protein T648_18740 [Pseudomonas aeruginosa MRSN 317]OFR07212.1 hypothetical protein HMPREF2906_23310 [Pseudomonas sp. HMSC065H02]
MQSFTTRYSTAFSATLPIPLDFFLIILPLFFYLPTYILRENTWLKRKKPFLRKFRSNTDSHTNIFSQDIYFFGHSATLSITIG